MLAFLFYDDKHIFKENSSRLHVQMQEAYIRFENVCFMAIASTSLVTFFKNFYAL